MCDGTRRRWLPLMTAALLVVSAGCLGASSAGVTGTPTPPTPTTPTAESAGTTTGPSGSGGVAAAPGGRRVNASETATLHYRGRNVTIRYQRANGTNEITVTVGDRRRTITRAVDAEPSGIEWTWDGVRYVLKPVSYETRDGDRVALTGRTWNVTTVELELFPVGTVTEK